jgi:hypothetical protein
MCSFRLAAAAAALLALGASVPDAIGPASAQAAGPRQELTVTSGSREHVFQVEIADDPRERAMGLMFRRQMAKDEGMLFDFGAEEQASFWMKNTYISLDMLFIHADGTIESIAEHTTPLSEKSVVSEGPVRYVLELNGGVSAALGIAPGDKVSGPALDAH